MGPLIRPYPKVREGLILAESRSPEASPRAGSLVDEDKLPVMADTVEILHAGKFDMHERAVFCGLGGKIAFQATLVREKLGQSPVPIDRRSFSTQ